MLTGARHPPRAARTSVLRGLCAPLLMAIIGSGCASNNLGSARGNYFLGRYDVAAQSLAVDEPTSEKDLVLFLMERGMIRQAAGQYTESAHDWIDAHLLADRLEYFSVSKQSASMLINDSVLQYRGMWYERALLHAFAAKSYFALSLWDDAAVEARNSIQRLERRGKYPDDPYSRYMNGFCLELSGDSGGAALQYGIANELLGTQRIDVATGRIAESVNANATTMPAELVCFISIGRPSYAPGAGPDRWRWGTAPFARVYAQDGTYLGRSVSLNTTDALAEKTLAVHATARAVKTGIRIVAKEVAAEVVEDQNELAGQLLRLLLFSLERPDERRWLTLPEWLQVARVPCPADLSQFTVEFLGMDGRTVTRQVVNTPITRRGDTYVSFIRAF